MYQKSSSGVVRLSDNAFIPENVENTDWVEYLKWVKQGNAPSDPPAPTEDQLQEQANANARAYLAETDWYVIRYTESGVAIPADITAKRSEARASIK